MPWRSKRQLEELEGRLAAVEPHAETAIAINKALATVLSSKPELTISQAHQEAVDYVYNMEYAAIQTKLRAGYIDDNVDEVYDDAVEKAREEGGVELQEQARQIVERDADLRTNIGFRARHAAQEEFVAEESRRREAIHLEILRSEAQRQLALNRMAIDLHTTTELDLSQPELADVLEHGDTMELRHHDADNAPHWIKLVWYEDSIGSQGWVYKAKSEPHLFTTASKTNRLSLDTDYFLEPGTQRRAAEGGGSEYFNNKLKLGMPLRLIEDSQSTFTSHTPYVGYNDTAAPFCVNDCQFTTREIQLRL